MNNETVLWCVHHLGSDDLFAANSKEEAEATCAEFNEWIDKYTKIQASEYTSLKAVVEPWPYTAEGHAENLREQHKMDAEAKTGINSQEPPAT